MVRLGGKAKVSREGTNLLPKTDYQPLRRVFQVFSGRRQGYSIIQAAQCSSTASVENSLGIDWDSRSTFFPGLKN